MKRATAEATQRYAKRQGEHARGFYRQALGLTLSSIGLGTYLGREDDTQDRAYTDAILAAVRGGVNVLDSAINYRLERSERAIGAALAALAADGIDRSQILVSTKAGYLPSRDPEAHFETQILPAGLARREDLVSGCHCIAPAYLRHQLAKSLANLGLEAVDVYYLHNPEQQVEELGPAIFRERMRAAFAALEEEVAAGRIGVYGTATWNGYRVEAERPEHLDLAELVELAREVAGPDHHFRVVQLPYNVAMAEAYGAATQTIDRRRVPLLEAAQHLGIAAFASASILQGRLARSLPADLRRAVPGFATDAQRALQFARSAPGVTAALVGMARVAHVEENLALLAMPPLSADAVVGLFDQA